MEKVKNLFRNGKHRFSMLPKRKKWTIIAIVVVVLIGMLFVFGGGDEGAEEAQKRIRQVDVASVSQLSSGAESLTVLGEVRSQAEADIRSVVQGRVTSLRKEVGDRIAAGEIIAEIENDAQLASLIQAEGAFEAAEAALNKALGGTREEQLAILETKAFNAADSLSKTQTSSINTVKDAVEKVDDIIHGKIDLLFDYPETNSPNLKVEYSDSQIVQDLESNRIVLRDLFDEWESEAATLSEGGNLDAALQNSLTNVTTVRNYVNVLASVVNSLFATDTLSQSTIDTWKTAISTSRTTLSTLAATINTQQDSLSAARAGNDIAQQELKQGVTGDRSEDVAAVEASLKQARGALLSARTAYNNTIIRSPISGTVNTLSISEGDFINSLARVATVANNSALEVRAFITGDDLVSVAVGDSAIVDGKYEGVVTNIGAGLDPDTKKVEVRIGLTDESASLVHGDSVSVIVERRSVQNDDENGVMSVPISALRIGANDTVVFSIGEDNVLVAHPVTTGAIVGDRIIITEGITPEVIIVVDARGLREGDVVSVSSE